MRPRCKRRADRQVALRARKNAEVAARREAKARAESDKLVETWENFTDHQRLALHVGISLAGFFEGRDSGDLNDERMMNMRSWLCQQLRSCHLPETLGGCSREDGDVLRGWVARCFDTQLTHIYGFLPRMVKYSAR